MLWVMMIQVIYKNFRPIIRVILRPTIFILVRLSIGFGTSARTVKVSR